MFIVVKVVVLYFVCFKGRLVIRLLDIGVMFFVVFVVMLIKIFDFCMVMLCFFVDVLIEVVGIGVIFILWIVILCKLILGLYILMWVILELMFLGNVK